MKKKEHKKGIPTALIVLYSVGMLAITLTTVILMGQRMNAEKNRETVKLVTVPEYIYVCTDEEHKEETSPDEKAESWMLRDADGQIGVFSSDGTLLYKLDVYTKTLPKADQGLLREGITASSRSELYALIEDYGG